MKVRIIDLSYCLKLLHYVSMFIDLFYCLKLMVLLPDLAP
jgi:hypothetical protein